MARNEITNDQEHEAWRQFLYFLEGHLTICERNVVSPDEGDDRPKAYRKAQLAAATKARDAVLGPIQKWQAQNAIIVSEEEHESILRFAHELTNKEVA